MARFGIATFSQADLLRAETDAELRAGICVALCDIWLQSFLSKPKVDAHHRMAFLATSMAEAKAHQKSYNQLRTTQGRDEARRTVGQQRDLDYDAQTTVVRLNVGMDGIRDKIASDLSAFGSAATWSLRFAKGGGHAIAGVNRIESKTGNIWKSFAHIFDPNIGEYVGPFASLPEILTDLFQKFPIYADTAEVHRTTASHIAAR
jgi:hypothetical protein